MERNRNRKENPSFSSTLLDSIYKSIDESNESQGKNQIFSRETNRKKQGFFSKEEQNRANLQKSSMIDQWMMERKVSEKIIIRRKPISDFDTKSRDSVLLNSSSSSSDSSSGCGISSNELYAIYGTRPKPIRTNISSQLPNRRTTHEESKNLKQENGFVKVKSKGLKNVYNDLKKVKQPISPGGKLASFLNSIFNGTAKKSKISLSSKSANESTCSSVSSFSRSCLSKTPSSRGNLSNGVKRSVRFVDENESRLIKVSAIKTSISDEARDLLKSYKKRISGYNDNEDDDDDEDDNVSCSSSDLFELDNLSAIGIERYRKELPVYETTHFGTNYAIANGLIM